MTSDMMNSALNMADVAIGGGGSISIGGGGGNFFGGGGDSGTADPGMPGTTTDGGVLSSWSFVVGISAASLVVSVLLGILLAKIRIKKGIDIYED